MPGREDAICRICLIVELDRFMDESHLRSVVKAISWRLFGTFATMLIVLLLTHKIKMTLYIGLLEFTSKIVLFYLHERMWGLVSFGRKLVKSA